MPEQTPASPQLSANVFISYRREDSAGHAGRLFDGIGSHFGKRVKVFMDIDSIAPGEDFINVIGEAVGSCQILVAIIGRHWLTVTDEAGQRRLDVPEDFVRVEIAAALSRNVRVIPVLIQGASMPLKKQLPDALVSITRRNAIEISDARWLYDVDRLIQTIEDVLGKQPRNDEDARRRQSTGKVGVLWREYPFRFLGIVLVIASLIGLGLCRFRSFERSPETGGSSNNPNNSNINTSIGESDQHRSEIENANRSPGTSGNSNNSTSSNTNTSVVEPPFRPDRHRSEIEKAVHEMRNITSFDLVWTGLRNDNDFLEFCLKNFSETWLIQEIPDPQLTGDIRRQIKTVSRHLNATESRHQAVIIILLVYRALSSEEKLSLLNQLQMFKSGESLSPKIGFKVWEKSDVEKALQ